MNKKMPRTPFSTALSGSARETEIRLKNIFSGPKKRPPVLFLALMFSVCIFCGNLVSCQMAQAETPDDPIQRNGLQQEDASIPEIRRVVPVDQEHLPRTEEERWLLQALFLAADEQAEFQLPEAARLLASIQGDGFVLGAAFVRDHLENTLLLGVMNRETKELDGPVFRCAVHTGAANVVTFRNNGGEDCLLYTFNGQENGQYTGEAGVVRFNNGRYMVWDWPADGDVRYPENGAQAVRGAYEPYLEYWKDHLAVPAPGGVDIYTVNPDFAWGKDEPASIWQLESGETFYRDPSSAAELPMPIYFQSLNWLVEHTSDPGGWRIASLELNGEKCDPEARTDCFTLTAREEHGTGELTAELFFSYDQVGERKSYDSLNRGVVSGAVRIHPLR